MTPKELLKEIRRIHIRSSHLANDVLAGGYHSAFKGQGIEFEEVREYAPGDDIRSIDWNVTARQGRPFVKRFREERETTVLLVVDVSKSQEFGTARYEKRGLAARVAATLAFSAIRNDDRVGLIGFSDHVERYVKPEKGTRHVLRVIREILTLEATGSRTSIATALEYLNRVARRRCVVFLISDFQDLGYEQAMRVARRRHDVVSICISDPREAELPAVRFIELQDAETGKRMLVDTASAAFRRTFHARRAARAEARTRDLRRLRSDSVELTTGQSYVEPLIRFFHSREGRR